MRVLDGLQLEPAIWTEEWNNMGMQLSEFAAWREIVKF